MNSSLVILLLVFQFTCHGKVQDSFLSSDILPTIEWEEEFETNRELSCPDPYDILPCECTVSALDIYLTMNCSHVQDEEQLRNVFSAFFPSTEFYEFRMTQNTGVKVLEDGVFGNVTFELVNIDFSVLEIVEPDALAPSFSTLREIAIQRYNLEIFPFETLPEFTSLLYLYLSSNKFLTVPSLSSSSLLRISLAYNFITDITPGVFELLPTIASINLQGNQLTEIPTGVFTGIPNLATLYLSGNDISYLQSFTFDLIATSYTTLDLDDNNIEFVEVDAFKGVPESAEINLMDNALTTLPEEVWRPVLEKDITVYFEGNNLTCDCDVAWLVRDPPLLELTSDAHCADGTLLSNLTSTDFDICG